MLWNEQVYNLYETSDHIFASRFPVYTGNNANVLDDLWTSDETGVVKFTFEVIDFLYCK